MAETILKVTRNRIETTLDISKIRGVSERYIRRVSQERSTPLADRLHWFWTSHLWMSSKEYASVLVDLLQRLDIILVVRRFRCSAQFVEACIDLLRESGVHFSGIDERLKDLRARGWGVGWSLQKAIKIHHLHDDAVPIFKKFEVESQVIPRR